MLKFAVEPPGKPALIGLGLSYENLRRIRQDAIQFYGSEVGLGAGVFVIAHAADPQLPIYQAMGEHVCDIVTLSEETCQALQRRAEVLKLPLRAKRAGRSCEALLFAGETEELLLETFRRHGLLGPNATVTRPETPAEPIVERTSVFGADPWNLIKLGGGGIGMIVLTVICALDRHGESAALLLGPTAAVLLALAWVRWKERIEMDAQSIRLSSPLGGFEVPWSELRSIQTREDSLGPYEVVLITSLGKRKLKRMFADWDHLIEELMEHAGVTR